MRRFAIFALALALGAPACDDDNPTGPSNSGPIVFTAELRASNEVPAISQRRVERARDASPSRSTSRATASGNVTGDGTWNVQAVVSSFTDTSAIRAAHIHNGAAGVNAGVFVDTLLTPANAIPTAGRICRRSISRQVSHPRSSGPGRPRQPGRQLLQHALAAQSGRRHPRPADSGPDRHRFRRLKAQGSEVQGSANLRISEP